MLVDRSDPLRGGSVVDGVDYCYVWVRYSLSTYQVYLLFEQALILVETWRESPRALVYWGRRARAGQLGASRQRHWSLLAELSSEM